MGRPMDLLQNTGQYRSIGTEKRFMERAWDPSVERILEQVPADVRATASAGLCADGCKSTPLRCVASTVGIDGETQRELRSR